MKIATYYITISIVFSFFTCTCHGAPQPNPANFDFTSKPRALVTNTISQYGLTWNFSAEVDYGQFINGDFYVIDPGTGVTVISVSPEPSIGRNGSILNPTAGSTHPFDDRVRAGYSSSKSVTFPIVLHSGDSLVSTISRADDDTIDYAGGAIDSKVKVKSAAILTILSSRPPPGTFRPAYCDRNSTLYNINQLNRTALLDFPAPQKTPNLDFLIRSLQRPWILFGYNWWGRDIHPYENMKGYHRNIAEFVLSPATLLLLTDAPGKERLIINYIQLGIDYYYIGIQGEGDSSFWVAPVIITGLLLNEPQIYNAFKENRIKSVSRDYPDFYYWEEHKSTISSNIVEEGKTHTGAAVFFRNQVGNGEHEHLDPSEWNSTQKKNEAYRLCCDSHPHVGMVLAAMMLEDNGFGMKEKWNHNATFSYIDRWMTEPNPDGQTSRNTFIDEMWQLYRWMPK